MTSAVYVISVAIAGRGAAALVSIASGLLFTALWFALPLLRRSAERQQ